MQADRTGLATVRHWAPAMLLLAGVVGVAGCSGSDNDRLEAIEQELSELADEVRGLREDVAALREEAGGGQDQQADRVSRLPFDDNPRRGSDDAEIAIVEFSDYQCPFCGRFHRQTLPQLKKEYIDTGKVMLVYRDFPLGNHPQAVPAAIAANCAGKQGAYWRAQKRLFRNQRRLGESFYQSLAGELDLAEPERYKQCLGSEAERDRVRSDFETGRKAGVRGTPTFFIGRRDGDGVTDAVKLSGAQPFSRFQEEIERLLDQ